MAEQINDNFVNPAISRKGVKLERDHALIDARDKINELGELIEFRLHGEDTIERDSFGSIIKRTPGQDETFSFYAFPIQYNPTIEQIEKAGLREKTSAILYTAMLDWWDNDFDMDRLNEINMIKMTVIINRQKFEIAEKNWHSEFSDTHLYVTLGLNKI